MFVCFPLFNTPNGNINNKQNRKQSQFFLTKYQYSVSVIFLYGSGSSDANKNNFYVYSFLKVHLHHSSKIKSHKDITKQQKSRFSFILFARIRTNKSRIRIQEIQKRIDPTDPDKKHCQIFSLCLPRIPASLFCH